MIDIATIDFHITARCSQACPYCWEPRRFRNPVDTETAQHIIARIKELGVRRIVFTGGDPLQRPDAPDLVRYAKRTGLETALSTTGDFMTPEILESLSPYLDLISLPLDGSSEQVNSRTKHPGHFSAVIRSLNRLRLHPNIDVKVCTPVTRHNLNDIPVIARLIEEYSYITQARVFYNVFQAFPRAMFSVKWDKLIISDEEFTELKSQVGEKTNIRVNFLSHEILDKLYVMVFPDGSITIPKGGEYINFGPFLDVNDFGRVLNASQFDSAKHLHHSRGCHAAIVLLINGQKFLVDVTIPVHAAVRIDPQKTVSRRTALFDYTLRPAGENKYEVERSHRPGKNLFTLVDIPVGLSDYLAIVEEDYTETTSRFLKSVVMVKVVDGKARRFFSDQKPYKLESIDRAGRMEKLIDPETLAHELADVFQMPEGSISAALSWIQDLPVRPCDQSLTLPVVLEGSVP